MDLLLYVARSRWICCGMLLDPCGFFAGCCRIHEYLLLDLTDPCELVAEYCRIHADLLLYSMLPDPYGFAAGCCQFHVVLLLVVS